MNRTTQPFAVPRSQDRAAAEPRPSEEFSFCGLKEKTVDTMPAFLAKHQTNAKGRLLSGSSGLSCWLPEQHVSFLLHAYAILHQYKQSCCCLASYTSRPLLTARFLQLCMLDKRLQKLPQGCMLLCFCVTVVPAEP